MSNRRRIRLRNTPATARRLEMGAAWSALKDQRHPQRAAKREAARKAKEARLGRAA